MTVIKLGYFINLYTMRKYFRLRQGNIFTHEIFLLGINQVIPFITDLDFNHQNTILPTYITVMNSDLRYNDEHEINIFVKIPFYGHCVLFLIMFWMNATTPV